METNSKILESIARNGLRQLTDGRMVTRIRQRWNMVESKPKIQDILVYLDDDFLQCGILKFVDGKECWFKYTPLGIPPVLIYAEKFEEFLPQLPPHHIAFLENKDKLHIRKDEDLVESVDVCDLTCSWKNYSSQRAGVQENIIKYLLGKVLDLEEKMEKMYYAPGMPGEIIAKNSFESKMGGKE
jgi:hypothetical protein